MLKHTFHHLYLPLLLVLLISSKTLYGKTIDINPITKHGENTDLLFINVRSADKSVMSLAQRAFNSHGGYRLAKGNEAQLSFNFTKIASGIELKILSGSGSSTKHTERFSGENWITALYKACDKAVLLTSRVPGFFSGKIVCIGEKTGKREVFSTDLFFQKVRQLTNHGSISRNPRWAPNGKMVLYTSYYRTGFPDIFQMDLAKSKRSVFATFKGTNTGATYNRKGNKVAMILSSSGNPELYISNNKGSNIQRITRNKSLEASPKWSPDGSKIILTSDKLGKPQLYLIAPTANAPLQRIPTNVSSYCAEPDWNTRNTNLIAFTVAIRKGFQIAQYDFNSRTSKILTKVNGDALEPKWLNDGRHILFTLRTKSTRQLHVLDSISGKTMPLHSSNFGQFSQADFVYTN